MSAKHRSGVVPEKLPRTPPLPSIARTHHIDGTRPEHKEGEEKKEAKREKEHVDTADHGTPTGDRARQGTDLGQRGGPFSRDLGHLTVQFHGRAVGAEQG